MIPEKNTPATDIKTSIDSQENVVSSIIVKTIATLAIGFIAWYFLQNMI